MHKQQRCERLSVRFMPEERDPALLKVLILGEGGVGKSSLLNRFVKDEFDPRCAHTVGVEFLKKELRVGSANYVLQIWDTAGQERFRSLRTPFYRGADVCLLVFAVDDAKSFERLTFWMEEFSAHTDLKHPERFPFIIVGNKADITDDSKAREVSSSEAEDWSCRRGPFPYIETSAKEATNVLDLFTIAIQAWRNLNQSPSEDAAALSPRSGTIRLHSESAHTRKRRRCC